MECHCSATCATTTDKRYVSVFNLTTTWPMTWQVELQRVDGLQEIRKYFAKECLGHKSPLSARTYFARWSMIFFLQLKNWPWKKCMKFFWLDLFWSGKICFCCGQNHSKELGLLYSSIFPKILALILCDSPTYEMATIIFWKWYIVLPTYATARIQTHVSRVAPTWELLKGALPTELPRCGILLLQSLVKAQG